MLRMLFWPVLWLARFLFMNVLGWVLIIGAVAFALTYFSDEIPQDLVLEE